MYMACLEMYNKNSDHKAGHGGPPLMSPRISFSNDLVESSHHNKGSYRDAPVSSDFEFSVNNHSMITADELFSKGKLLPFKGRTTTLRDELLNEDHDYSSKPPKNPTKLRSFLGLRKPHKKSVKSEDVQCSKNSQGSVE